MTGQILVIVHQAHSTPGRVGELLVERGFALDRRCPNLGDPLPDDLSAYAGAIVFGGPQSANDDHMPGIRAELDWLERHALPSTCPLLGICLGAQEIARVLGASVGPHPDGLVEIGYWPVWSTEAGCDFLNGSSCFYQWHSETFEIPAGAVHLAGSDPFPAQAFCYDQRVYGIEFHPEITRGMINHWCTSERGVPKLRLRGAQPHRLQLEDHARVAVDTCQWLGRFLNGWLRAESAVGEPSPDAGISRRGSR